MTCFSPGTRIATPRGEIPVEELAVGDAVISRDNGIQTIRWMGTRGLKGADLTKERHLRPVRIQKGALGRGLPERDMLLSPNHRVLVASDQTALYFDDKEVLVAAKHLTGLVGVDIVDAPWITYICILFDDHEMVLSDGSWTECFQPGAAILRGTGHAQRAELIELFPELIAREGIDSATAARRSLERYEARLSAE